MNLFTDTALLAFSHNFTSRHSKNSSREFIHSLGRSRLSRVSLYFFFLCPRRNIGHDRLSQLGTLLASKFLVHYTATNNRLHGIRESSRIIVFAIIEPEGLLIQIAEKMEGFNANVSSFDRSFSKDQKFSSPLV